MVNFEMKSMMKMEIIGIEGCYGIRANTRNEIERKKGLTAFEEEIGHLGI